MDDCCTTSISKSEEKEKEEGKEKEVITQ